MVTGSVNSRRIGLRNVFKIPKTMASTSMVIMFATSIPGVIYEAINIEKLLISK